MASFFVETRQLLDGELRFRVKINVKKNGRIVHRESKTFRKKALAQTFGKRRVNELEHNGIDNIT